MTRRNPFAAIALLAAFAMPGARGADKPPPNLLTSLSHYLPPVGNEVHSLAYSPDGTMLAVGALHDIRVWDLKTGKENFRYKYSSGEAKVAFSPNGKSVAVSRYRAVELLDPLTGKIQSKHKMQGVDGHLAFSPAGKTLARARIRGSPFTTFPP